MTAASALDAAHRQPQQTAGERLASCKSPMAAILSSPRPEKVPGTPFRHKLYGGISPWSAPALPRLMDGTHCTRCMKRLAERVQFPRRVRT